MNVKIAVLSDYANITNNGKLNIMGIFSQINSAQEPIVHQNFFLIIQLEFEFHEHGTHALVVAAIDADGREVFKIDTTLDIPRSTDHGAGVVLNAMFPINQIVFDRFGKYDFKVSVNDETITSIPLDVSLAPNRPAPPRNSP